MKYIVVGDVHGDLNQFLYPLIDYFRAPNTSKLIYLGDYLDRGDGSIYIYEILRLICKLRDEGVPEFQNIITIRGNHDTYPDATPNLIGACITGNPAVKDGTVVSYIAVDFILNIPLSLYYYDSDTNIIFSHSPSPDINPEDLDGIFDEEDALSDKSLEGFRAERTTTSNETEPREYTEGCVRNVHGHVHRRGSDDVLASFFSNGNPRRVTMVSMDGDASYGCWVGSNAYVFMNPDEYSDEAYEDVCTELYYVTFEYDSTNGYHRFNPVSGEIPIINETDGKFNRMPFDMIKARLTNDCNPEFAELSLDESFECFKDAMAYNADVYGSSTDDLKKFLKDCITNDDPNEYRHMYFQDIPWEFYKEFGYDGSYKPPWEMYWSLIVENGERMFRTIYQYNLPIDNSNWSNHGGSIMTGGGFDEMPKWAKIIIIGIVVVAVVVTIVVAIIVIVKKEPFTSYQGIRLNQ